jgi:ornithine cyclodeaminase
MIFLDKETMVARSNMPDLVDALQAAFAQPAITPERLHASIPGEGAGTLLIMPAWQDRAHIGIKIVTVLPDNPANGLPSINGIHILLDGNTGAVRAILDASALTGLRTSAVSALASRFLSRPSASTMVMLGTGPLSENLVRAHATVRQLKTIVIWGRDPAKARALAERLGDLNAEVRATTDLANAVAGADIVSCATNSDRALVHDGWVRPGCHLDLVGSFSPKMIEVDPALLGRARLVVDTQLALKESGDLIAPLRDGIIQAPAIELANLAAGTARGRSNASEITIFKSVGTGLADIAAARYLLDAAGPMGKGLPTGDDRRSGP